MLTVKIGTCILGILVIDRCLYSRVYGMFVIMLQQQLPYLFRLCMR